MTAIKSTMNLPNGSGGYDTHHLETELAQIVDIVRQPNKVCTAGDITFCENLPTGWYLECTTGGTTGAGAITLPSAITEGTSITDGTVEWSVRKMNSGGSGGSTVSFQRTLSSGTPIGTLTINGVSIVLYSTNNTTYSNATTSSSGLMSSTDKQKLNSINVDSQGHVITKTGRYGFRIDERNSDPATRVEYIFDAEGMGPVGMDFTNGTFDYGDWGDIWFVKNNKPLMLKSNGTVDYYLDPNDYTKKESGAASDVANTSYDGNAMAQIPLVWVKRWQDGRYKYVSFCDHQYDSSYKAYAHTDASGSVKNYFYWGLFEGSGNATKIRSLSGQTVSKSLTAVNQIAGATANGSGWYIHPWSQRELIKDLCILLGKSTDTQDVFGNGNCRGASSDATIKTGTIADKGQFFGSNTSTAAMKVFHIENFWGNQWDRIAGLINNKGTIYVKMTPQGNGYRTTDVDGYVNTELTAPAGESKYINGMVCSEYGMIPNLVTGSGATYYCDGYWANNGQLDYLLAGAGAHHASAIGGAFAFDVNSAPSLASWNSGCGLSYV